MCVRNCREMPPFPVLLSVGHDGAVSLTASIVIGDRNRRPQDLGRIKDELGGHVRGSFY